MSRRQRHGALSALPFLALLAPASSFYLPGMAPTSYGREDSVPLYVNHLKPFGSDDTGSVSSVVSFDYYSPEFHFCKPEGGPTSVPESLGSIIFGDRIYTSAFDLKMMVEEDCKAICPDGLPVTFTASDSKIVNARIQQSYLIDWLVDGLPSPMYLQNPSNPDTPIVVTGFPLGVVESTSGTSVLHNHYDLVIEYHQAGDNEYRVVGFEVNPYSHKDNKVENGIPFCGSRKESNWVALSETGDTQVTWTYSVKWRESNTVFATRWDKYLHVIDPKIHWFWLINSAIFVCLLVAMVSSILVRTLRKDIARYNRLDEVALEDFGGNGVIEEGVQEDSGWKLVHGDVFRPPKLPLPLSVLIGNGTQLFLMTGFTIGKFTIYRLKGL
jgi:transmembrane 9 superfamily member 2/4